MKIMDDLAFVKTLVRRFTPSSQDRNDLIQAGMLGLLLAKKSYDESKGDFHCFAYKRILGKIIDEIRFKSWRYQYKDKILVCSIDDYFKELDSPTLTQRVRFTEHVLYSLLIKDNLDDNVDRNINIKVLEKIYTKLPQKIQKLFYYYFHDDLNYVEVAAKMKMKTPQVYWLITNNVQKIKRTLCK